MLTVNGYTLFPHNGWSSGSPVKWSRKWQTGMSTGVLGGEARSALRQLPLHKLSCELIATCLGERARLDARVDQALKSGLGAIPFYGRAMQLAATSAAGSNSVALVAAPQWSWAAGDYVFLYQDDETFDAVEVTGVAGLTLALAGNLNFSWAGGSSILWPLLFGKFTAEKSTALNAFLASWMISVEQLASERNAQVGSVAAPAGSGVGVDQVGVSNTVT